MKKVRKIFVTIVLSIFLVSGLSGCSSSNNSNGYYNNIKWGISIKDLEDKLKLENDTTVSDDNKNSILQIVNNFDNIDGVQAWVMYFFEDDKLSKITITPTISKDSSNMTDDDLNKQLYNNLVKSYGDPVDSSSIEYKWNTKYSNISLTTTNYIKYEEVK